MSGHGGLSLFGLAPLRQPLGLSPTDALPHSRATSDFDEDRKVVV